MSTDIHGPLNFPFPDQLPEQVYPSTPDDELPELTVNLVGGDGQAETAISSDAARKNWVDAIAGLVQKPPHRAASSSTKLEYELMLQQVYKRMSRLMRADLDEPGVGP